LHKLRKLPSGATAANGDAHAQPSSSCRATSPWRAAFHVLSACLRIARIGASTRVVAERAHAPACTPKGTRLVTACRRRGGALCSAELLHGCNGMSSRNGTMCGPTPRHPSSSEILAPTVHEIALLANLPAYNRDVRKHAEMQHATCKFRRAPSRSRGIRALGTRALRHDATLPRMRWQALPTYLPTHRGGGLA
jgi:hypothetical protein